MQGHFVDNPFVDNPFVDRTNVHKSFVDRIILTGLFFHRDKCRQGHLCLSASHLSTSNLSTRTNVDKDKCQQEQMSTRTNFDKDKCRRQGKCRQGKMSTNWSTGSCIQKDCRHFGTAPQN